ncbi:hypothetical protein SRABI96_04410 [Peribacillus sp. Bi96]|uniref:hypothetical protein n=1 Tax=unclassified Peribacillus TaxID=2675266 RepID=UPI001D4BEA04|nr:hypothetical protein [Peribacillus sp. Bi96]CAH0295433.1 hypothetical protein SRABI96_04410 [Peribacillus sp. Bi96]
MYKLFPSLMGVKSFEYTFHVELFFIGLTLAAPIMVFGMPVSLGQGSAKVRYPTYFGQDSFKLWGIPTFHL